MGEYIRKKKLGSGGFGEVWLARHVGLNVDHAVKFVTASSVLNPSQFYSEPRLLKELQHSNVVTVHDAGVDKGDLFIAMEVLDGSVDDLLKNGPLKLRRIKHIFCGALKGLEFVHDKKYLHRDVKPANILVNPDGHGKLSDFGLAIPTKNAPIATPAGTLTYVAPEILITGETSVATDIYAMGVSVYEAVNGSSYLPAVANTTELKNGIVSGKFPDRSFYRAYIPRNLKTVINRAMNPDPAKRYSSADEFRLALEQTTIACSWTERQVGNSRFWVTENNDRRIEIELAGRRAAWAIIITQVNKRSNFTWRMRKFETLHTREAEAIKRVQVLTTCLVSGIDW